MTTPTLLCDSYTIRSLVRIFIAPGRKEQQLAASLCLLKLWTTDRCAFQVITNTMITLHGYRGDIYISVFLLALLPCWQVIVELGQVHTAVEAMQSISHHSRTPCGWLIGSATRCRCHRVQLDTWSFSRDDRQASFHVHTHVRFCCKFMQCSSSKVLPTFHSAAIAASPLIDLFEQDLHRRRTNGGMKFDDRVPIQVISK
ncbi:hypothetical protein R3P38DRAFT_489823 [Favolaschia claudopus]|uniref:Uncharacterized protein n=1 Tax=Favolaschia claudopus TaxID=2862362 RepID=A0AAW0CLI8_9AGAR